MGTFRSDAIDQGWAQLMTSPAANSDDHECIALADGDLLDVESLTDEPGCAAGAR